MRITDAIADIVEKLEKVDDIIRLRRVFAAACGRIGIRYFNYTAQIPVSLIAPEYVFINNYPKKLWRQYIDDNLLKTDPLFHHCAQNLLPVVWNDTGRYARGEADKHFMRLLRRHGLQDGITFPVRSRHGCLAVVSFAADETGGGLFSDPRQVSGDLILLGTHLCDTADKLLRQKAGSRHGAGISRRERECMLWVSEGKTTDEVGRILDISASTVTFHIQNVIAKLEVCNRQQAIARAVALGVVMPQTRALSALRRM